MNIRHDRIGLVLGAALILAACGGGGGDAGSAASTPTAAVDTSTLDSFRAYQATLPVPETIDPATLRGQLAPIDDTAEPTRL